MKSIISLLVYNLFLINFNQNNYEKYNKYILHQLSLGEKQLCVIDDSMRLNDPNRFYSIFLFDNKVLKDSLSLENRSSSGSQIKTLFLWQTKRGCLPCIEYNEGSGIGHHTIMQTKLFVFDINRNKIEIINEQVTDSLDHDSKRNFDFETTTKIYKDYDTLYVVRYSWRLFYSPKNVFFKQRMWVKTTMNYFDEENKFISKMTRGEPYFFRKRE